MAFTADCRAQATQDSSVSITDSMVIYETPMAYELMHIAFALTDTAIYSGNINVYFNNVDTSKIYYKEVIQHFGAFKNHRLIVQLNKALRKKLLKYIYNLDLAYNSAATADKIKKNKQFPFFPSLLYSFNSVSRKSLNTFAQASGFNQFYAAHSAYYQSMLEKVKNQLNAQRVKTWLEKEFPSRYDAYRIVVSPLMNGLHFTRHFNTGHRKTAFMWVSDAARYSNTSLTNGQTAGIYTGVVFTEIDHNYVNPVSDRYEKQLNQLMGNDHRKNWVQTGGDEKYYGTGYKIFNEYMTHAVYLLYTNALYPEQDQKIIEDRKINGMEKNRKYYKFGEFYHQLKTLYLSKTAAETITSIYPKIIEWCNSKNQAYLIGLNKTARP